MGPPRLVVMALVAAGVVLVAALFAAREGEERRQVQVQAQAD